MEAAPLAALHAVLAASLFLAAGVQSDFLNARGDDHGEEDENCNEGDVSLSLHHVPNSIGFFGFVKDLDGSLDLT